MSTYAVFAHFRENRFNEIILYNPQMNIQGQSTPPGVLLGLNELSVSRSDSTTDRRA